MKEIELKKEKEVPTLEVSEEDKMYTAGFFDGEGYVGVYQYGVGVNTGFFQLKCSITNSNLHVLEWIRTKFGGSIHVKQAKLEQYQHIYHVTWVGKNCQIFLKQILPYVKIKKQQIEVALLYPINESREYRTREMIDTQWRIYEALKKAKYTIYPIPQQYLENIEYKEHSEHLRKKQAAVDMKKSNPEYTIRKIAKELNVSPTMIQKYLKDSGISTKRDYWSRRDPNEEKSSTSLQIPTTS